MHKYILMFEYKNEDDFEVVGTAFERPLGVWDDRVWVAWLDYENKIAYRNRESWDAFIARLEGQKHLHYEFGKTERAAAILLSRRMNAQLYVMDKGKRVRTLEN